MPGLFTPEQTATLLAQRDVVARRRVSAAELDLDLGDAPSRDGWRAGRRTASRVNRLVSVVASRRGSRTRRCTPRCGRRFQDRRPPRRVRGARTPARTTSWRWLRAERYVAAIR